MIIYRGTLEDDRAYALSVGTESSSEGPWDELIICGQHYTGKS